MRSDSSHQLLFFFFFFFWAGVGLLKYKTETRRTQVHVPFANNFIIAKCIIGSLHFFFIIFFFKVCTQNIKSASDQRSHRVGQCTSDQKSAGGGGGMSDTGGQSWSWQKRVLLLQMLLKNVMPWDFNPAQNGKTCQGAREQKHEKLIHRAPSWWD